MKKQIIINNIKSYNNYKNTSNTTTNVKSLCNNVIKETKKSYIELSEKTTKLNIIDLCCNILDYYDNYDIQLSSLINIYQESGKDNQEIFEKQHFLQALKKKLSSYKQQDIKKTYDDYNNFITLENIIEKLVSCAMKCYYCDNNTLILFKNAREETQWTLDRLNNFDEHSNTNTVICCLKCNLQKRRKNSAKFKLSKQLNIIKKIE
jgi:hypothetical protein